jgi:hypothetical protein
MEAEVRDALRHLITAFENHLEAVASRRSPDDAAVDDAYEALAAAFERYEEKLDLEFAEGLPVVLDDVDVDDEDDVEDDEAEFEYVEDDDVEDEGDVEDDDIDDEDEIVVDAADDDEIDDLDEFSLRD